MTRKRARHLMLELSRRVYLNQKGTLKGFGKMAKLYGDSWRPCDPYLSYKDVWSVEMKEFRKMVGM